MGSAYNNITYTGYGTEVLYYHVTRNHYHCYSRLAGSEANDLQCMHVHVRLYCVCNVSGMQLNEVRTLAHVYNYGLAS